MGVLLESENNTGVQRLYENKEKVRMILFDWLQLYLKPVTISELLSYLSYKFFASPPNLSGLSLFDLHIVTSN